MDSVSESICKNCREPVAPTNFFCSNCGNKLRNKPPGTTLSEQVKIYIISTIFWPFGIIYIWRYLSYPDKKAKMIGFIVLVITVAIAVFVIWLINTFIGGLNKQINSIGL